MGHATKCYRALFPNISIQENIENIIAMIQSFWIDRSGDRQVMVISEDPDQTAPSAGLISCYSICTIRR